MRCIWTSTTRAFASRPAGIALPSEDEAVRLFGALGIERDTEVGIYDDQGGLDAARLFCALAVFGHARAALLDGGIESWRRAGYRVTQDVPAVPATTYRPRLVADAE